MAANKMVPKGHGDLSRLQVGLHVQGIPFQGPYSSHPLTAVTGLRFLMVVLCLTITLKHHPWSRLNIRPEVMPGRAGVAFLQLWKPI